MEMIRGYGVEATLEGDTLTVRGTDRMSHYALVGPDRERDAHIPRTADGRIVVGGQAEPSRSGMMPDSSGVSIHLADIDSVTLKAPALFHNGRLDILLNDGRKYELPFLKKHHDGFVELARALGCVI